MVSRLVMRLSTALLLVACGQSPDRVSATELTAAEAQIAAVTGAVYGTSEQRSAGERRVYELFHGGVAACMTQKGFTYDAPSFVDATIPGSRRQI